MEASAIQARGIGRTRVAIGTPLLRLRTDQQLVALFRAGNEDAFRVIHDRYRPRLLAYMRQMLVASPFDAEDLLQDVFVRAYRGLRTNTRDLSLRPWLYRVARNRCVDELRRPPQPSSPELLAFSRPREHDPVAESEQRESLRRLIIDVGRLPEQQRSALLLRELSGMSYTDVAAVLEVSVPAVKSLLVRARVGLAQALDARDTACGEIRELLVLAHDRGVRPNALTRRHLRDCDGCREYRAEVRGISRQLAALAPGLGPLGVIAKLVGVGGGTSGGAAAAAGAGTSGAVTSAGALTLGHVTALVAAAVITAGGAVDLAANSAAPAKAHHAPAASKHVAASQSHATPATATPPYHARRQAARQSGGSGGGQSAASSHSGASARAGHGASGGVSAAGNHNNGNHALTRSSPSAPAPACVPPAAATTSAGLVAQILTAVTEPTSASTGGSTAATTSTGGTAATSVSDACPASTTVPPTGSTTGTGTDTGTAGSGTTGTTTPGGTGSAGTGTDGSGTGSAGTGTSGSGTGGTAGTGAGSPGAPGGNAS